MKKLSKRTYKGIEYIRLSSLSATQTGSLSRTLNDRTLIKILMGEAVLIDCVLFSAYEKWYANYTVEELSHSSVNTVPQLDSSISQS